MKAISVRQPWAGLIARGEKTIETRTWTSEYRGPLVIVSSRTVDQAARYYLRRTRGIDRFPEVLGRPVAVVDLVAIRRPIAGDDELALCRTVARWCWILENARPVYGPPVRGRLGLFEVDVALDD